MHDISNFWNCTLGKQSAYMPGMFDYRHRRWYCVLGLHFLLHYYVQFLWRQIHFDGLSPVFLATMNENALCEEALWFTACVCVWLCEYRRMSQWGSIVLLLAAHRHVAAVLDKHRSFYQQLMAFINVHLNFINIFEPAEFGALLCLWSSMWTVVINCQQVARFRANKYFTCKSLSTPVDRKYKKILLSHSPGVPRNFVILRGIVG